MPIGLNEGNIGRSVCPGFGKSTYHCGIPDSGLKRNLQLCPTGNRILGVWISGRSLVYFIFLLFLITASPWMLAETRSVITVPS